MCARALSLSADGNGAVRVRARDVDGGSPEATEGAGGHFAATHPERDEDQGRRGEHAPCDQ